MIFRSLWKRLITGDGLRKTRFHTFRGNCIDLAGLVHLPHCIWSSLLRVFGYRLPVPWLGYRAVKYLRQIIQPEWRIIEYGSGMSSLFFAKHGKDLVSIESDRQWFDHMRTLFSKKSITNIDYRFRDVCRYTSHSDLIENSFDLCIVDGLVRDESAKQALKLVRPGGYIFMDNSDVQNSEYLTARNILQEAAIKDSVKIFNDFYPFRVGVNEGMLVQLPEISESQYQVQSC